MRIFIDTEFTRHGGELMALAMVPEFDSYPAFYAKIAYQSEPDDWVKQNVIPVLGDGPVLDREEAAYQVAAYLRQFPYVRIVADWPEDIAQFMLLLLVKPGQMVNLRRMQAEFERYPGFNTSDFSAIPHNALEDAKALRDYVINL